QAVDLVLQQGRQAIVLVPEIALTPQTVRRFMGRFPGQVGLMHSRLSPGERFDTWRRARNGVLPVIIGPRSALFTPLPEPGLIIVDECHDDTYYQSDYLPYYHAVDAALQYGALTGAQVLLGSATPLVTQQERARREHWQVLRLAERISTPPGGGDALVLPLPRVEVVDLRQELRDGNRSIFSRRLQDELHHTLDAGQQAILFLNRRGSATFVFCRACGYSLRCPRCDLPLTLHLDGARTEDNLLCHTCGYHRRSPARCPQCGSDQIRHYGTGTEKVESELHALFPQARALRMDSDSVRRRGSLDLILTHFANHQADILIGTQMLAKGLDLPLVTLVGVVLADVGLNFPDYRAEERTFQLLTQVAGRAGRSTLGGLAVIQTYQPHAAAIHFAALHDDIAFHQQQLAARRRLGYPPFARLARLEYRHRQPDQARQAAHEMAEQVQHWITEGDYSATEVIGPVPCFFQRREGYWRWQVILRGPNPANVLRDKNLREWQVQIDPVDIL
ncbi:MAG: primosomal protein N', partial [Anaerolineae bacterium]|nr:primosomal protein N' [Anaerolineae bacterium]